MFLPVRVRLRTREYERNRGNIVDSPSTGSFKLGHYQLIELTNKQTIGFLLVMLVILNVLQISKLKVRISKRKIRTQIPFFEDFILT